MSDTILLGVSTALGVLSLIFYSASLGAQSKHYNVLEQVSWAYVKSDTTDLYLGFRAIAVKAGSAEDVLYVDDCHNFTGPLCTKCFGPSGRVTLAFIIIALSFTFLSLLIGIHRFSDAGSRVKRFVQQLANAIVFGFSLAAFVNYHACQLEVEDEFGHHDSHYGAGFGLAVAATFFTLISFVLVHFTGPRSNGFTQAATNQA